MSTFLTIIALILASYEAYTGNCFFWIGTLLTFGVAFFILVKWSIRERKKAVKEALEEAGKMVHKKE